MNYEIVELEEFSGNEATIYSIIMEGNEASLFDHFVEKNINEYRTEVRSIITRLEQINYTTGARDTFFKPNEGKPGDGVCALYDEPDSKLRLYCIRYGSVAIILGGGGSKPKRISAWQEDSQLDKEANRMIEISNDIMRRLKAGDLQWSKDGSQLLGTLTMFDDEE